MTLFIYLFFSFCNSGSHDGTDDHSDSDDVACFILQMNERVPEK